MVVEKYVADVGGFDDAWIEMYKRHVYKNNIIDREIELQHTFEKMHNCRLYQRNKASDFWYNFDTIEFPSEPAYTMFLLKWS